MRALLPMLLLVVACGPGGNFQIADKSYAANMLAADYIETETLDGVDITLEADPVRGAVDDELSVRVSLLWQKGSTPTVGEDLNVSGNAYLPLVRVSCFCGGKDEAFVEPTASGKVRFSRLVIEDGTIEIVGELDLSFKGQIALTQGGVLYDDALVKVRAVGFRVQRQL